MPVKEHPQYQEFLKFRLLGVKRSVLSEMMGKEELEFDLLDEPEEMVPWKGPQCVCKCASIQTFYPNARQ